MSYTSLQQLTDRYGEPMLVDLTDRADTGVVDQAVVDRALADTDAMIDGYLAGRYALPLASTPAQVADLAQAIAVYKLHKNVVSEKIRDDYRGALKMLEQIAAGTIRLDVAGVEPAASGSSGVRTNEQERPLTAETMKGYI
jgi:phage gp36-like protein